MAKRGTRIHRACHFRRLHRHLLVLLILIRYNPHSCLIKLNIDVAIFKNNLCFGLGMCISDEHGRFIKARIQWNYIDPTPTKAELWALLQGLLWIHELGVQNITIEID